MRRTLHDLATLAARVGVGGIFFANGWHKLEAGLTATGGQFETLGAPAPGVWAATTMLTELLGGALLVAGLAVPACGLLLFAEAVAVFVIASGDPSQPLTGGDVNLIVALGAASILLAVSGAGRLSVDHMVVIKRRDAEAAEDFAADSEAEDVLASLREPRTDKPAELTPPPPPQTNAEDDTGGLPKRRRTRPAQSAQSAQSAQETSPASGESPGKENDTLVAGRPSKADKAN